MAKSKLSKKALRNWAIIVARAKEHVKNNPSSEGSQWNGSGADYSKGNNYGRGICSMNYE